ncbi:hypothetical protein [Haliangium sp.]|uniref:hypothetical protein n=1 Tax=Haliangium sp. TaxID=2663208 RepID=UPI003D0E4D0E
MTELEALERRIEDLEARQHLLLDVVFALADQVKPEGVHAALRLLLVGYTAAELEALNALFKDAVRRGPGAVTREELARAFDDGLPRHRGELAEVMKAYRADGRLKALCRLVLDE